MVIDERLLDEGFVKLAPSKGSHKKKTPLSVKGALHQSVVELLQFVEVDDFSLEFSSEKCIGFKRPR